MRYTDLSPLEQAGVALRDCGMIYCTGNMPARVEPLVRLGLAESCDHRRGGVVYRLTTHGRRALDTTLRDMGFGR